MLANLAYEITGKRPGKNWASRWLKKYSDTVISQYSTGMDSDRKRADKAYKYALYFEHIGRKIKQYNLSPGQIYNMDEKGFMLGILSKEPRIFSKSAYEQGIYKQFLQDGSREWITTIACICANGTALSPALIYAAKSGNLQDSWLQDFETTHTCYFGASETGWTNNEFGLAWLQHVFDKETKAQASRGWRLLILDGHGSHVNMKFVDYCDKNRILLALFPAHSTHNLQPLDVSLFSPLAKAYSKELSKFLYESYGLSRVTKRDFFRLFYTSWQQAFIPENIFSGFKNTGLSPFDPAIILQRFNQKSESRPSSSKSATSALSASDWRQIRQLLRGFVTDVYDEKAKKLENTVLALTTENALLKSENEGLKRALTIKEKHRSKGRPLLFNLPTENEGGAIFLSPTKVQQARALLQQKDEQAALEKARKSDKKLQQQLKKEAKELEKIERAQFRQKQQEERQQEAAKKQLAKEEQELAKLADLQLQKDVLATPKPHTNRMNPKPKKSKPTRGLFDPVQLDEPIVTTNRRGRQIRLPERFR